MPAQADARPGHVDAEHRERGVHGHLRQPGRQRQGQRGPDAQPQRTPARETERARLLPRHRRPHRGQHPGQQHQQCRRHPQQPHPPVQLRQPPQGDRLLGACAQQLVQRIRENPDQLTGGLPVPRHEQADRYAQPDPVRRPQQRRSRDPPGMVVTDRRVRRRRVAGRHGRQRHRDEGGHGRPHHPVQDLAPARQGSAARGEQRDQQDPGGPGQPAQQCRHGVDREADGDLGVDEVTDPVGQQPADVPHITESRNLEAPAAARSAAGQAVQPERATVDRHDVVPHPGQSAQHRHEQGDHRARTRQEFGGCDHDSGRPQRPQEEERQEQRTDQPHTQWRDLDGGVRLSPCQPERGHVPGRCDRTSCPEGHDRRGHRPRRARRVRVQKPQTERGRPRHPDQRPAHGGDRGHQDVAPRDPGAVPLGSDARGRAHGRPPEPRRGGVAAHVPSRVDYHSPGRFQPRQRKRPVGACAVFTRPDFRSGGRA